MGGTICRCNRGSDQVSRSMILLPFFVVNPFLQSIEEAEDILGYPGNIKQIEFILQSRHKVPVKNIFEISAITFSLLREDMLYID